MIVRESYRPRTVRICREHYNGTKALPSDAPSLGPVESARGQGCEFCEREKDERRAGRALLDRLEREETDSGNELVCRRTLRDERLALHSALDSGDAERIRRTAAEARRVLAMWV